MKEELMKRIMDLLISDRSEREKLLCDMLYSNILQLPEDDDMAINIDENLFILIKRDNNNPKIIFKTNSLISEYTKNEEWEFKHHIYNVSGTFRRLDGDEILSIISFICNRVNKLEKEGKL